MATPASSTDAAVTELRRIVHSASGLLVGGPRTETLVAVATECGDQLGLALADYVTRLSDDPTSLARLLEDLVVGETYFGRIPEQRRVLRATVLPGLLDEAAGTPGRRVRIWSAGCSTGEEAYDVALILADLLDARGGPPAWDARVIGTDLSEAAITVARHGQYSPRSVALLPQEERERHLAADGARWCVSDRLRRLVELRVANLVRDPAPEQRIDLVLLRNVTIYFDRETTRRVLQTVLDALRPGGWLLMGHSETLWQLFDGFSLERHGDAFLYRKPVTAAPAAGRMLPTQATSAVGAGQRAHGGQRVPARSTPAPDDPLRAAQRALDAGAWRAAASAAASAVARDPLAPEAHQMQGRALIELGRDDEALLALRRAVYLDARRGVTHLLLAGVLARLGHPAESARAYSSAAAALGTHDCPGIDRAHARELAELCRQLAAGA